MKGKFSLNRIMHNDRLMIIFSVVASVAIWAAVVYGPTNVQQRTISGLSPSMTLSNPAAINDNLRIIGSDQPISVSVVVKGPRWVIAQLRAEDIQVRADMSNISTTGDHNVSLIATKSVSNDSYEIESITPTQITVHCDVWQQLQYTVEPDIETVSLADALTQQKYQLGTPLMDTETLQNDTVTIEGPKTVLSRINRMIAKVEKGEVIDTAEAHVFPALIKALDSNGAEIDLSDCKISTTMVNVTVPVLAYRQVTLNLPQNMPEGFNDNENFFTVTPKSIELLGSPDAVADFAQKLEALRVNFDNLTNTDTEVKIPLDVPDNVTVLGDVKEIVVTINMRGFSSKTMELTVTEDNVELLNKPAQAVSYYRNKLTDIRIMGNSTTLKKLKESDLYLIVDMKGNSTAGATLYKARIGIKNYKDVWVYYGEEGTSGIDFYVTVEP